jgi:hypothetical protein
MHVYVHKTQSNQNVFNRRGLSNINTKEQRIFNFIRLHFIQYWIPSYFDRKKFLQLCV